MAQMLLVNPRKRAKRKTAKRKSTSTAVARVKSRVSTGLRSIRRKYRRNPIQKTDIFGQFKDGAIGAAGALAVDIAMAKLPIPDNLKTGQMKPIVQGLVGIGIGMAVSKFGKNKSLGKQLAGGAVTVSLYNAGRQMLAAPLGLAGYDDQGMLGYQDSGLLGSSNEWDSDDFSMGFINPAPSFPDYDSDLGQNFDNF